MAEFFQVRTTVLKNDKVVVVVRNNRSIMLKIILLTFVI